MVAPLRSVAIKRPQEAFSGPNATTSEWKELAWTRPPNLEAAAAEHQAFVALLKAAGAEALYFPEDPAQGWIRSTLTIRC